MAVTMESATFMGKNFQNNRNSVANTTDLTLKQMFGHIFEIYDGRRRDLRIGIIWLGESFTEISVADLWRKNHQFSTNEFSMFFFQILYCVLWRSIRNPESNKAWKERTGWNTSSQSYRNFDGIDGELTEFEWTSVKCLLSKLRETSENFHMKNSIYVDVQRHFLWNKRQWTRLLGKRSTRVFVCRKIW